MSGRTEVPDAFIPWDECEEYNLNERLDIVSHWGRCTTHGAVVGSAQRTCRGDQDRGPDGRFRRGCRVRPLTDVELTAAVLGDWKAVEALPVDAQD